MSKDNGGPAFPSGNDVIFGEWSTNGHAGMTLRDYFAAKALQGICASENHLDRIGSFEGAARTAYELADAMIAERNKQ